MPSTSNPVIASSLSYAQPSNLSAWGTYLAQVDRVTPYLGPLARWAPAAEETADCRRSD